MLTLGIDLSNNNPGVDMRAAYRQGVRYLFAKAQQGWNGGPGGWPDWTWCDIVDRTRDAGIIPGGYHWPIRGNGRQQAHDYAASLARRGGPRGFLCALDVEATSWTPGVTYDPRLSVDPETVDEFFDEWDIITNRHPIFYYGAPWYHVGYMGAGARWSNRPLWLASYNGARGPIEQTLGSVTEGYMPQAFGGWNGYAIRQYTDFAIAGGVEVDANATTLTIPQLLAMTQPNGRVTTGGLHMDADVEARFDKTDAKIDGLIAVIQGDIPKAKNIFGLVGTRDLKAELDGVKADVAAIKTKVAA